MASVFVSHSHKDADLASAVKELIRYILDSEVTVDYPSDTALGEGIPVGTNWLDWIMGRVRECDVALMILSPESLSRPWLMWDAGAVSGVPKAQDSDRRIIPLLYRVNSEDVPGPLLSLPGGAGRR